MAMIGAVVKLIGTLLRPTWGSQIGKEKGWMTQMMERMNTTRVAMEEPETMDLWTEHALPRIQLIQVVVLTDKREDAHSYEVGELLRVEFRKFGICWLLNSRTPGFPLQQYPNFPRCEKLLHLCQPFIKSHFEEFCNLRSSWNSDREIRVDGEYLCPNAWGLWEKWHRSTVS